MFLTRIKNRLPPWVLNHWKAIVLTLFIIGELRGLIAVGTFLYYNRDMPHIQAVIAIIIVFVIAYYFILHRLVKRRKQRNERPAG